jgi:hypothetical protein
VRLADGGHLLVELTPLPFLEGATALLAKGLPSAAVRQLQFPPQA